MYLTSLDIVQYVLAGCSHLCRLQVVAQSQANVERRCFHLFSCSSRPWRFEMIKDRTREVMDGF
jgi:hypothetical protein